MFSAGHKFFQQSGIYNGLMTNSTSETPCDVVMKTAGVKLSCHMNIDLKNRYLRHRKWKQDSKKPLFCLKLAFKKNPLFSKGLQGACSHIIQSAALNEWLNF